ncbi:MAG: hypothetical protein HOQ18_08650 [Dermatophilaceae bacterium]|nr:hypothetical protein [Dermatophilaceae bacterium]NUO90876.1 hypothetical protein [Dermatophilaceae bacterium]NUR16993.1 hypothetical protein [Dermatophilaceae bacterium]NUR78985.1 hypothetical protein [Dermatophilaceae bacterium]
MATTTFLRDFLWRKVVNPATNATDALGRATSATADYSGRALFGALAPTVATPVTLGTRYQHSTGVLLEVITAGTTAAGEPAAPGFNNTVTSGTATFRQVTTT